MVVPSKNRVEVLDMLTNRVITSLGTDDGPNSIAVSPDGRLILVSNLNSGTVSVFLRRDNDNYQQLGSIGNGKNPVGIAFNPNIQISEAYVAYEGDGNDGKVLVLDTRDKSAAPRVIRTISLQNSSPKRVVVSSDGNRVFVTDSRNAKLITLTRTGTNFTRNETLLTDQANRANTSLEGAIIDSTNRLFIANNSNDTLIVVNGNAANSAPQTIQLRDNQVVGQNQVGPRNLTLFKNPTTGVEKIYVTGYNASVVSVIDPKALRLIKNIPLAQNTQGRDAFNPVGIGAGRISSGDDVIYVTNTSGLTISLINPTNDVLLRNISSQLSAGAQAPLGEMVTVGPVR